MSHSHAKNYKIKLFRVLISVVTFLLMVVLLAYGTMWILVNGPSDTARRLFVLSVKETSAGGFLADLYLDEEEIQSILAPKDDTQAQPDQDLSLIVVPDKEPSVPADTTDTASQPDIGAETDTPDTQITDETAPAENDGIEVIDIRGSTYNGKLMIISDPTRVFVGVPDSFGENSRGLTVAAMIEKYDCIAGTNAGGFVDPNGKGTGGIPEGIVIFEGELLWGELYGTYNLAGLDKNGILHVGSMTAQRALELGVQYAASYGPALVINGKAAGGQWGLGGGLNPRTAIGQRADGAILLLVINGRSVDSLGATLDDLASIMLSHGAVNATNLDGGSSSLMIMNGEYLTTSAYLFGERVVATTILVK